VARVAEDGTGSPVAVSIRGLSKTYVPSPGWMRLLLRSSIRAPVPALVDVSFDVLAGQICAIVGPNGAGKSTLFRVLTGLTTPTQGSATILGLDVTSRAAEVRRVIGFMPADDRSLLLRQTCRENLAFHGRLQGLPERGLKNRLDDMLDLVGLGDARDRVCVALSAGMRARLQLARALLHEPAVLILDEPTGAVDPVASYALLSILIALTHERKLAVLLSSHRLEEIEALHDSVIILDRGRIIHFGDLDTLRLRFERPSMEFAFRDVHAARQAAEKLDGMSGIEVALAGDGLLEVVTTAELGALLDRLGPLTSAVVTIREVRTPLREVLAAIYRAQREQ